MTKIKDTSIPIYFLRSDLGFFVLDLLYKRHKPIPTIEHIKILMTELNIYSPPNYCETKPFAQLKNRRLPLTNLFFTFTHGE